MYELLREAKDLFDIFAVKQEYTSKKDKHGRFLYKFSNNKKVLVPAVSEYIVNKGFNIEWPDNHKFAACLTHDVDSIFPTWKYTFFTAMKFAFKLKFQESLIRLINKFGKDNSKNPYLNFKKILEFEGKYGATSSFYFKTTSKDPIGWIYDVKILKDELGYIIDYGGEVGLHGGYYSYNNSEMLKEEKNRLERVLGRKVAGVRMHYLRFDVPQTWRLLADLGFKYDTTFGYPDMPGFRNGMCHPFRPYDLEKEKYIDILEIPLTVMDTSLFKKGYEKSWILIKKLVENTEKNRGVITIYDFSRIGQFKALKIIKCIEDFVKADIIIFNSPPTGVLFPFIILAWFFKEEKYLHMS
ncbi:MAG: polysaccharide deacetylase family protein [Nitrososphaerota archaeon]